MHPGGIHIELARHMDPSHLQAMVDQISKQLEEEGKGLFTFKTIPQGAATSVWAGVVASADEIGGSGMAIPTVLKTNSTKLLEVLASSSRESLGVRASYLHLQGDDRVLFRYRWQVTMWSIGASSPHPSMQKTTPDQLG